LLTLGAIGQEITANLDEIAVFQALDRHVHSLLDATCFMVYLLDDSGDTLELAFGIEDNKPLPRRRIALASSTTHTAHCARERREIKLDLQPGDAQNAVLIPGTMPTRSLLFAPLIVHERLLGVMSLQSPQPQAYGEREQLIFRNLCAYGAIALDNAGTYRQLGATLAQLRETQAQLLEKNQQLELANHTLEQYSLTDTLTGLRNRRFLQQQLDGDVAIALRQYEEWLKSGAHAPTVDTDLIFFMVDLDQFKRVNDHHGHAVGDRLLVQMRERLLEVFRESDYLVRWGGEEVLIVARASNRQDAPTLAERIRKAVADRHFDLGDGLRLAHTCSLGFACYPFIPRQPHLLSWSQVVELADQGLYMAKRAGRNAWVGLLGKQGGEAGEALFERLMHSAEQAAMEGQLQVLSSQQA
jgi:diguanylate cyclase (GGDEF)-like protein